MKRPNFKAGQLVRTSFAGERRTQVYRLDGPIASLGGKRGGAWWCVNISSGVKTNLNVDSIHRVGPSEAKRLKLIS